MPHNPNDLEEKIKAWKREWFTHDPNAENRKHFVLDGVVHLDDPEDCEQHADWLERVAAELRKRPR